MTQSTTKTKNISNKGPSAPTERNDERFAIRMLAQKTNVGSSTLRAWERRYGLLQPERTPKGHRLYSAQDVARVGKILDLLNDGHSLPAIAEMLKPADQHNATLLAASGSGDNTALVSIWNDFISNTLQATADFNIERIDAIYNEASSLYPVDMVTDRLIFPTIAVLGEVWQNHPERGVAEEHFYTSWLKNRLGARFHHAYAQAKGARIICACVPGSYHEIGLMLFSLSALARGYRVLYFGADLPFTQLKHIAQRSAAKAIVLSAQSQIDESVNTQLPKLIKQINTPVFIGGSEALIDRNRFEQAGGIVLGANMSVALNVFARCIPAYPPGKQTDSVQN